VLQEVTPLLLLGPPTVLVGLLSPRGHKACYDASATLPSPSACCLKVRASAEVSGPAGALRQCLDVVRVKG
jgi:hypothetical protein